MKIPMHKVSESEALIARVHAVQAEIATCCAACGRKPEDVRLMMVSKTVSIPRILAAMQSGVHLLGENRVQEIQAKAERLSAAGAELHLIGSLQRNKIKDVLPHVRCIHSLDRPALLQALQEHLQREDRQMDVLCQVNTSGEASKSGVAPEDALELMHAIEQSPYLKLKGLMTIAVFSEDEQAVRACFRRLRQLRDQAEQRFGHALPVLSMGMSADMRLAIEEGSTLVRVGSAIFGARS